MTGRDGGGLWRLRFANIENPSLGGTLQLLLDGTEEIAAGEPKLNKPDNMAIDAHGNLLIQEDPGSNNHLARIVAYRISDGALGVVGRFDAALFGAGSATLLTIDEESGGIVDTEAFLGAGTSSSMPRSTRRRAYRRAPVPGPFRSTSSTASC